MLRAKNPFAPGAGTTPPELTGRNSNLESAQVTLERVMAGRSSRSALYIGLRGVGKTVLLKRVRGIAEGLKYKTAMVESPENSSLAQLLVVPLRKILLDLDSVARAKEYVHSAIGALKAFASSFNLKIGEISISVEPKLGVADSGILETDIGDLLIAVGEAAKAAGTGVALFIDELQYVDTEELSALIAGLHRVSQEELPLVLFGAGLPQLRGLTGEAKSYAERLFDFQDIGKLNKSDAIEAVKEPIKTHGAEITTEALDYIFETTEGYPYFLQEWGMHCWDEARPYEVTIDDAKRATALANAALDRGFFGVRFDRLTPLEKEYIRAMAELGPKPHRSGDIAQVLARPVEQVAPTRSSIIKKGMIYAPAHGDTAFTVPKFDEYMKRIIPEFEPTPTKARKVK